MNYLAHAFLSNNNNDLLVGNFIADHVRGNHFENYPKAIVDGIYMHRSIDAFTDAHPLFKASKRCFYNGFEKYSGVLIDIYFDHLLAKHFDSYSKIPLADFSKKVYSVYETARHLLPQHSSNFLDYVLQNNIYVSYANMNGIEQVLTHLSHRVGHGIQLNHSVPLFKQHQAMLENNFAAFFMDAQAKFLTP